jgi:Protein of unknown function (DUF2490)
MGGTRSSKAHAGSGERSRGPVRIRSGWLAIACLLLAASPRRSWAQDERFEVWPELDVWVQLSPDWKLFFPLAISRAREVDYTEALVGAHIDYRFSHHLSARVGYRFLWAPSEIGDSNVYTEHRGVAEITVRAYPGLGLVLLDRNRFDLRYFDDEVSWRYRNRARVERTFPLTRDRSVNPYAMVEVGYDSRFDVFNRVRMQLGVEYQFSRRLMLDTYYLRQWDDYSSVPRLNALGLAFNLMY